MNCSKRRAAISFTGGKDSSLVYHLLKKPPSEGVQPQLQERLKDFSDVEPVLLVTFVPAGALSSFKAHSLEFIKLQAQCLDLPHKIIEVSAPYLETYQQKIKTLGEDGIDVLATGDILEVCDGFMRRATEGTNVDLLCPLWQIDPDLLLSLLWKYNIKVIVTCLNVNKFISLNNKPSCCSCGSSGGACELNSAGREGTASILKDLAPLKPILGQTLDPAIISLIREQFPNVDACGEYGEYHTMLTDSDLISKRVSYSWEPALEGDFHYMALSDLMIVDK